MRAFILLLPAVAACGTDMRQAIRDLGGHELPDSHVTGDDGGAPSDLAGVIQDLTGSTADLLPPGMLDPNLSLPNANGQTCTQVGYETGCPAIQVCRFYSPTEGRCESCTTCGNLHATCSASNQCDILFMCYQGKCTNFCTLGTSECGPPADCINIGHPTRGVCKI